MSKGKGAEPMLDSLETYAGSMGTYRRRSDTLGMPRHKRAIIRDGARSNTAIILTTCSGSYGEMRMVKMGRVGRASRAATRPVLAVTTYQDQYSSCTSPCHGTIRQLMIAAGVRVARSGPRFGLHDFRGQDDNQTLRSCW